MGRVQDENAKKRSKRTWVENNLTANRPNKTSKLLVYFSFCAPRCGGSGGNVTVDV
jgi:hypothetical protein